MTAETPRDAHRQDQQLPPGLAKGPPRLLVVAAIVLIVAAAIVVGLLIGGSGGESAGATHVYTIPPGSFQRLAAGEDLEVIPAEVRVAVGDSISIRNEDAVGQTVGPYYVPAGQTVRQTFTEDATLEGVCTAHKDGRIRIVVGNGGGAAAPGA